MKRLLILAAFFIVVNRTESSCAQAPAGSEAQVTVVPTFDENGNTLRLINVAQQITLTVIISSEPQNAVMQTSTSEALGISSWRFREIVNTSTCAYLFLEPDRTYTTFISSFGIVLGYDTTGAGIGDSYVVPSQTLLWGIWGPTSSTCGGGGQGAGGYETYYLQSGKR